MTELAAVSRGYLTSRPIEAARVLGRLDAADVAAFLAALPASVGAAPLAHMAPWKVARCLADMAPATAAELVSRVPAAHRVRALRAMPRVPRDAVIEVLPRGQARLLRRQLRYPASLVGAWMTGDVATLQTDATVADALAALRARNEPDCVQVYVSDERGQPLGLVAVAGLLQVAPEQPLAEIMRREIAAIPADAPWFRVDGDRGWRGLLERPVIDARGYLVGALSLGQLAAARERTREEVASSERPVTAVAGGYIAAISGLARIAIGLATGPGARHER
ncbi:MAG: CBS domain-containing protein [Halofilum sp. (in: g-proteobacteria)]